MKTKLFLGLSLLANIVLLVAFVLARQAPETNGSRARHTSATTMTSSSVPASHLMRPAPPSLSPNLPVPKPKGTKEAAALALEVEDYPEFIKKLRAAGLSEDTIATLVVAEIIYRGLEDNAALQWKLNTGELTQDDYDLQHRQLQKGYETAIESLLGKDGYRQYQLDHDFQLKQLIETGVFPKETIEKYFDLRKAQEQQIRAWEDELRGQGLNPADYADKRSELEKAYQEKLASELGADVASKIRAETDWQIQRMRRQLSSSKLTESEYTQIGQLLQNRRLEQQRLSALQQRGDMAYQDAGAQRQAIDKQYTEQLTGILGPQRQAELDKQHDWAFRQMTLFGRPNGMNEEQIDYVYRVIKDQQTRQQDLRKQLQSKQVTRPEYDAAIEQMNAGTRKTLGQFLGPDRYERLKRAMGQVP